MITFGSDCTQLNADERSFCGELAEFVSYDEAGESPIDVLCRRHRRADSRPIDPKAPRAERACFWIEREGHGGLSRYVRPHRRSVR